MRKILPLVALLLLSACQSPYEFRVVGLTLLEEQREYEESQERGLGGHDTSRVVAQGMVEGIIETENDLFAYVNRKEYNLWYHLNVCENNLEIGKWPEFYEQPSPDSERHRYAFLFDYKTYSVSDPDYNLARDPQDLCMVVGAGAMIWRGGKSDIVRIPLSEDLKRAFVDYEARSGKVTFEVLE